jgi:hypothetical protein
LNGAPAGTHLHPTKKLGRAPLEPDRYARTLRLKDYLTGRIPEHPESADYTRAPGLEWGLYTNDRFGVCGPTEVANSRRQTTAWLTGVVAEPSLDDVYDLYRASGNTSFDPTTSVGDHGVVMQRMLDAVVQTGIGGVRAAAYARIDPNNLDEMRAALALFGGVHLGLDLTMSQTTQDVWDYVPADPVWGGHAVLGAAYTNPDGTTDDRVQVITWGQPVPCTHEFLVHQVAEAYVLVWPEHLTYGAFLDGVNVEELAVDYEALTGRPFPRRPFRSAPEGGGGTVVEDVPGDVAADVEALDELISAALALGRSDVAVAFAQGWRHHQLSDWRALAGLVQGVSRAAARVRPGLDTTPMYALMCAQRSRHSWGLREEHGAPNRSA